MAIGTTVAYIGETLVESLIEINEGMSELLDKQVDKENENLKIKIPGFTQALVKCAMKIKESRKKRLLRKNFLLKGGLYKAVSEDWLVRFQ